MPEIQQFLEQLNVATIIMNVEEIENINLSHVFPVVYNGIYECTTEALGNFESRLKEKVPVNKYP